MLSIIAWIVGLAIAAVVIYFLVSIFLTIRSIRQVLGWAKEEASQLPSDYQQLRKEVANENGATRPTLRFFRGIVWRWYKRM